MRGRSLQTTRAQILLNQPPAILGRCGVYLMLLTNLIDLVMLRNDIDMRVERAALSFQSSAVHESAYGPKPPCKRRRRMSVRDFVFDIGRPLHRPCLETITGHC